MHGSRSDCLYVEMQIELKCEYKSLTMREKMGSFEVYGIICEILASYVFRYLFDKDTYRNDMEVNSHLLQTVPLCEISCISKNQIPIS